MHQPEDGHRLGIIGATSQVRFNLAPRRFKRAPRFLFLAQTPRDQALIPTARKRISIQRSGGSAEASVVKPFMRRGGE